MPIIQVTLQPDWAPLMQGCFDEKWPNYDAMAPEELPTGMPAGMTTAQKADYLVQTWIYDQLVGYVHREAGKSVVGISPPDGT